MKTLIHLFYGFFLIVPVCLNFLICLASYRWHTWFKIEIAKELEQLRKAREARG
jgi:hypothetical protein